MPGHAFGGMDRARLDLVEMRPLGLDLAHARCQRVRVQAGLGQQFEFVAELAAARIVAPSLPLGDLGVLAFDIGETLAQRSRDGADLSAQAADAGVMDMRFGGLAGLHGARGRFDGGLQFVGQGLDLLLAGGLCRLCAGGALGFCGKAVAVLGICRGCDGRLVARQRLERGDLCAQAGKAD